MKAFLILALIVVIWACNDAGPEENEPVDTTKIAVIDTTVNPVDSLP